MLPAMVHALLLGLQLLTPGWLAFHLPADAVPLALFLRDEGWWNERVPYLGF